MKNRFDNALIGFVIGVLLPIITLLIYIEISAIYSDFDNMYQIFMNNAEIRLRILTIAIIPNLFLFYFVNNRWRLEHFTRGFVLVTVLLGLIAIIFTQL